MLIPINYKKINFNYSLLKLKNLFFYNNLIIFFYIINIPYTKLYEIKNELILINITSIILNKKYVKNLFCFPDFKFLNSYVFCIFSNNINHFINISNILNNIEFFYLFENSFSNIINKFTLLQIFNNYMKYYINIQNNIKKIIFNIIFLILYCIFSLLKYIK